MFKTILAATLAVSALGAAQAIAAPDVQHVDRAFKVASSVCHSTHQSIQKLSLDRLDIAKSIAETGMRPELEARLHQVDKALRPHLQVARHPECAAAIRMYEGLLKQEEATEPPTPVSTGRDDYSIILEHGDVCARSIESLDDATARRKKVVAGMKFADGGELSALDAELIAIDTQIALDLATKREAACIMGTVARTEDPSAWRAEQCMLIAARIGQIEERLAPIGEKVQELEGELTASSMMCASPATRGFCMIERQEREEKFSEIKEKRHNLYIQRDAQQKRARGLSCPGI